ncbi:MAG: glycosyltransferase family 4 protein [Coriobacteriia bacterium]|nr:glycosyltransferase family 4 protein [Coriobacteriia bacterium]
MESAAQASGLSDQPGERTLDIAYLCLQVTKEGQASYAHVHEIVGGLKELGHTVTLYEPRHLKRYGPLVRACEFVRTQRRMQREARGADVVYYRAHFATLLSLLWARRRGIPTVLEVNGPYEDLFIAWPRTRYLRPLFEWMMGTQYRRADALVTVTPGLQRWLAEETGRHGVFVVPNAANHRLFQPEASPPDGLPDRYVTFVGALAVWQGIPHVLEAVGLPEWPDDVSLLIAGAGAQREMVLEAAGKNERVVYLGRRPYTDIPGILCGSIAALVPMTDYRGRSNTGLSPLKLYEAMACGVAVVATDFPGQSELLRDEQCGIVIPPEDPSAIARAVRTLAEDPEAARAMGERGRKAVEREHSWVKRAEQTAGILLRVAR